MLKLLRIDEICTCRSVAAFTGPERRTALLVVIVGLVAIGLFPGWLATRRGALSGHVTALPCAIARWVRGEEMGDP